jgi:hypothetical protein
MVLDGLVHGSASLAKHKVAGTTRSPALTKSAFAAAVGLPRMKSGRGAARIPKLPRKSLVDPPTPGTVPGQRS